MNSRLVESHKKTLKLTSDQRATLVGILLGDACLESQNGGRTYRLKIEQSARDEPYVRHLFELFEPWTLSPPRQRTSRAPNGTETSSWAFRTVSHAAFRFYAQQYYRDGRKCVPKLIHRWLTPRGLAYWFMDDGSMKSSQSKGVILNTQCYGRQEVERLVGVLGELFQLEATDRRQREGHQVYISGRSYERFIELAGPFVIPEMRYKLPPPRPG